MAGGGGVSVPSLALALRRRPTERLDSLPDVDEVVVLARHVRAGVVVEDHPGQALAVGGPGCCRVGGASERSRVLLLLFWVARARREKRGLGIVRGWLEGSREEEGVVERSVCLLAPREGQGQQERRDDARAPSAARERDERTGVAPRSPSSPKRPSSRSCTHVRVS